MVRVHLNEQKSFGIFDSIQQIRWGKGGENEDIFLSAKKLISGQSEIRKTKCNEKHVIWSMPWKRAFLLILRRDVGPLDRKFMVYVKSFIASEMYD